MNKKSLSVWLMLVCLLFSLSTFVGGDEVAANVTPEYLKTQTLDDDVSADVNSDDDSEQASAAFGIWDYAKVLLALVFVLGLLLFVLKFLNKKNITYQQNNMMQNLGGISVGQQKSVQVVKVGNRILIVGVGDNIQVLTEIEDEAEVDRLIELYEDQFNQSANKPYIANIFEKFKPQKKETPAQDEQQFSKLLDKRLSEIKKERSHEIEKWKDKEHDNQ